MTYAFLQHYWWFLVSLLGALLVFLMFVQGANSMIFSLGKTDEERRLLINSTGRKWEFTFTTLVTFGGAFFASFPLFYSTSFGGAYWLWMIILFSFVMQAVSYEFQNKVDQNAKGFIGKFSRLFGPRTFQYLLVFNGVVGPLLLGGAVATFFDGSNFIIEKENLLGSDAGPIISSWANASHGLDALLDPWNLVFAFAVFQLARVLGILYIVNNVNDAAIRGRANPRLIGCTALFLVTFLAFLVRTLLKEGFAVVPETGEIQMESMKYLHNFLQMPYLLVLLLIGVVLVLYGIIRTVRSTTYNKGIWPVGIGVVLVVLALLVSVGWNNTAYYPSLVNRQYSLTIQNSSSSEFTLRTMFYVSFLIPFVLAYIFYAWRKIDSKQIDKEEIANDEAY